MDSEKSVKLRGTREGFSLSVDASEPYDHIEKQTEELFLNLRQLAKGARVRVDSVTSDMPSDILSKLGEFLKSRFGVQDVFQAVLTQQKEHSEIPTELSEAPGGCDMGEVKLMSGRVRSGQRITAEKHLIILGDVNPGGEVFAGGDILVLGSLCGTAIAGQPDGEDAIILSLDFRPTQVQIAGFVAAGMTSSTGKKAEYAYVENGAIMVDDYVAANPFGKQPVLKER